MHKALILVFVLGFISEEIFSQDKPSLMPMPQHLEWGVGQMKVTEKIKITYTGNVDGTRVRPNMDRYLKFLNETTGLFILKHAHEENENGNLSITVQRRGELTPWEDESYDLHIDPRGIVIEAETDLGVIHALQTLRQLLVPGDKHYYFPFVSIHDEPRFRWRGLLMDVCRHFMPMDVIKRNIRGMNFLKMNVFHWHLTEDQGFRIESKKFPKLLEGSGGKYYTQEQVKEIIQYADSFGIRVIPEFDMPGHTTSWFVGHPELASRPGPYKLGTTFGVQDAAMDPTKPEVYSFLDTFLTEMAGLFPDEYIHIGGDEVNGKVWDSEPHIVEYKLMNGHHRNEQLQAHFNREIYGILTRNNKKMIGWDEILQPELGQGHILIQSWRGKEAMFEAAEKGYQSILSQGYYIDLCQPSSYHYENDPIPIETKVSEKVRKNILGGEATMWAELVDELTVDSRIWPRTAAIAERLWSPVQIRDVRDMYFRLWDISRELRSFGLLNDSAQEILLDQTIGDADHSSLSQMIQYIQPIKGYARHRSHSYTTSTPLNRIPDAAVPDPLESRKFYYAVQDLIKGIDVSKNRLDVQSRLETIRYSFQRFLELEAHSVTWQEDKLIFQNLDEAAALGLEVLKAMDENAAYSPEWKEEKKEILKILNQPTVECELAIYDGLYSLIDSYH